MSHVNKALEQWEAGRSAIQIAKSLKLTRERIYQILREHPKRTREFKRHAPPDAKPCPRCGQLFEPESSQQVFCGCARPKPVVILICENPKCKRKFLRTKKMLRVVKYLGSKRSFCSHKCWKIAVAIESKVRKASKVKK
jgi:uncharacterized C2H2 Zn-finger protein